MSYIADKNCPEEAVSTFNNGFNCAQAVISTYSERYGLEKELAFKVSCAFGGGICRTGDTCGAVTGALMVLGLQYGMSKAGDDQKKQETYARAAEFIDRFRSRNGSIVCRDLLGCDISKPEGSKAAKENRLFETICPKMVRDAAEILDDMLK
ncbi:hypothetical protein CUJ83_09050 [Methanocella sp. CWC-04]|uniref:C_GCAxxG_C_C family redox protein n=1 Tax=Methanooceanicella nereidis TaxID=2052831 RepID=A0AAP2RCR0_9EURY|nr:C-GCAxxG-C-C family protein [Methanocella sp. CWC-04]MCD1295144.1 hypothetical protein [Methanocella sp. CWC-04]